MTHLKIEQNTGTRETVASSVIKKLYDLAKKIELDANGTIALKGWLYTSATYLNYITYLENISKVNGEPLLTIDVGKTYKSFVDPNATIFFANCPAGDGTGILESDWNLLIDEWSNRNYKYGYLGAVDYFGANGGNYENATQYSILLQINHFPEMIDLPTGGGIFGSYYMCMFYSMNNLVEIYAPKTCSGILLDGNSYYNNLELIDTSTATNYTDVDIPLNGQKYPKIKKVICAPSIICARHGSMGNDNYPEGNCDIFFYCTNLDLTWFDNNSYSNWNFTKRNCYTFWVLDSQYNNWLQHPQFSSKISDGYITLKKFSEYTGNDLIQRWVEQPS